MFQILATSASATPKLFFCCPLPLVDYQFPVLLITVPFLLYRAVIGSFYRSNNQYAGELRHEGPLLWRSSFDKLLETYPVVVYANLHAH